jgi:hypothetical protein
MVVLLATLQIRWLFFNATLLLGFGTARKRMGVGEIDG